MRKKWAAIGTRSTELCNSLIPRRHGTQSDIVHLPLKGQVAMESSSVLHTFSEAMVACLLTTTKSVVQSELQLA